MAYRLAVAANGLLAVPGGYPLTLATWADTYASATLPKGIETVSVEAYATKSAKLRLTLLSPPSTVGGADGATIVDLDDQGDVSKTYETVETLTDTVKTVILTLPVPTVRAAAVYLFRLSAEEISGTTADTEDHITGTTGTQSINIPNIVTVDKITVS